MIKQQLAKRLIIIYVINCVEMSLVLLTASKCTSRLHVMLHYIYLLLPFDMLKIL